VPDEIVDRFCIIGPPEVHVERMNQLKELGVDQFSIYLQHDDKDHTLQVYGDKVMPAVAETVKAKA
jgi:alkanesulfonate monooxygenase SsuD/methylene tetrahydromethanopterin reductase-like flavin-dependent oxidoreductase (luciferase family)